MLNRIPSLSACPLFLLAAGIGLVLSLRPQTATAQEATPAVQVPDTADAVVQVRGMACANCARRMKSALEDVEGIDRATVLLDKQNVVLTLSDETMPSEEILRRTVTNAGYEYQEATFAEKQTEDGSGG